MPSRLHRKSRGSRVRALSARSRFAILIAGLVGVALPLAAAGQQTASLALAVETFDEAWRIIDETHFDTEFNGVDWDGVRDELRPRAEAAESMDELRGIISDMLGRPGQSHFALWPREMVAAMRDGDDDAEPPGGSSRRGAGRAGFSTVLVDGAFLVAKVEPGAPAAAVGIRPGWVVRTIGDVDLAQRLGTLEENLDAHDARVEAQSIVRYL